MTQRNRLLTRQGNRISLTSAGRTATQEDCLAIIEREIPVNTIEQTCIYEVEEKTLVGRTTPRLVDTLVKIMKWLKHVGSGKIDDSRLEARHNIRQNFRTKGIGL